MKSDRQHNIASQAEEDTSDLAEWFKKQWPRLALGAVLVALIAILVYQRIEASRQRVLASKGNVAMARYNIQQLQSMNPLQAAMNQEEASTLRQQYADTARDALAAARTNSSDPKLLAEADVTQGDLDWTLANLPALPGATTRPALQMPKTSDEYLDQAAESYQQVLSKYPNQSLAVVSAHFGLGAVAENKKQWDEARKQYDLIAELKNIPQVFRDQATARAKDLATLQQPTYLAPATQPATAPSTQESATHPSTLPATRP